MITGVDISRYQPDWRPALDDDFVFIKATEGRTVTNPLLAQQTARAREAGLVVGFYHYLWPANIAAQAAYFVRTADPQPGDILVCDWEEAGKDRVLATIAEKNAFLAEVKGIATQHRVGLYTYQNLWATRSDKQAGDFLWIAHYGPRNQPGIAEPWTFWQWTDKPIDQNRAQFASRAELRAWARNEQEDDMALTPADLLEIRKIVHEELTDVLPEIWKSAAVDILKVPTASDPNNTYTPASVLEQIRRKVD